MRVGILGGTFDPVHEGHLRLARAARKQLSLERVYFVPSYITPLRRRPPTAIHHRIRMIRLAIRPLSFVRLNLFEARRKRVSYTIDTIRYFKKRLPKTSRIYFLLGQDVMGEVRRWRQSSTLLNLSHFAVAGRPGVRRRRLPRGFTFIPMPPCPVSSSEVRQAIRRGKRCRLVPRPVMQYIKKRRLYGA